MDFDQSKITNAIFKTITATNQGDGVRSRKLSDRVVQILNRRFKKDEIPDVEQIQDIVEEVLILEGLVDTAKAYILYREQRRKIREAVTISEETVERMDQYLEKLDWEVQENANMAFSLQGLNHYAVSQIVKKYWLNKIYPQEIREANESGDFHVHNLDTLGPYCAGWDLYDLLLKGFGGVAGKVETKPAKHFRAILGQAVNFLYTLQGEVAGAVAFSNFDTLLAPFIRYDNLNYQQTKQALQEFMFNMSVPTRVGFQNPFSNITLDLKPSPVFAKQPVIIGGKPMDETYGEFEEEMKIFNKALYEVMVEGDAKQRVFTFPIPTINITKDFPWDDPNFDHIFEASAKYGINYFANYINSDMNPADVRSMCLDGREEILVRNSKKIKRNSIKEIAENYKKENFDKEGWADCKKEGSLEVLSLNPQKLRLEWSLVKRFLKIADSQGVEIAAADGKKAVFSLKHPVSVYTPEGIRMKFAKDVQSGDYLLTLKKANDSILSKEYQKIDNLTLNEDLAKILGYFTADGNYLFENRKGYTHYGEPRGLQFTFKTGDGENLKVIKFLIKKTLGLKGKEKQDPRYNTYYLYIYNTELARKLYKAGFKKYGRLPQILFNSPASVIKNFLDFYFLGDGYAKRKEIHLNDLELSRDLVLLFSLIGEAVTYRLRKRSQVIYLQHAKSKVKKGSGWTNNPILAQRVPGWMAISTAKVPGLDKSRMVGFDVLKKYNAYTNESLKIQNSDIYLTRVKSTKIQKYKQLKEFYDIELEKNHLFVHSLGQISFNCCRLRLDLKDLYNRGGGGLFGSGSKTGSIGVITINLPRIGYTSKTKKDFLERLGKMMDLAKESLEIKRKTIENFISKGLYPYSRFYLSDIKKARGGYYANHFATIGLVGMNEAIMNFLGENIASRRGRVFALEVLDFMRKKLVKYQEETGNIYNLEATPAESTAYRLALKDRELYPEIITAGTKKIPYYTNSTQLPVNYTNDIFEALKLQDEIQCKYNGGCVEKGNKVLTDKGLLIIEDIVENFESLKPIRAVSYNEKLGISEWDKILKAVKIDVRKHNKIRIKGERNLDITTSDWHPFFVLEKFKPNPACPICEEKVKNIKAFATHIRWNSECKEKYQEFPKYRVVEKRADELKIGDYILQNSHNLYPEKETQLDNDLMWLFGFFVGDGCISKFIDNRGNNKLKKYKLRFFSEHQEALDKVANILNKYFNCRVKVIQNEKRSKLLKEVSTSKKEVSDFFFRYGFQAGKKVYDVSVPLKIKENFTRGNVLSFLVGLMDSDGHLSKRYGDLEYSTVSSKLAEDILEICSLAGIMISKTRKQTKKNNEVDIWRLRIPKYEMIKLKNQLTNTVHFQRIKENLSNRRKRYLPVVRVKEVSKVDVKDNQFYDLMTEKNHNYLAGKDCLIFIHNTVLHLFAGEKISDTDTLKSLIKKVFENFHLPYVTFTPTFSICPVHGYVAGEHFFCPQCTIKQPCEVYSRIVGYLRPVQQWNEGKQEEFKDRKEFKLPKLTAVK